MNNAKKLTKEQQNERMDQIFKIAKLLIIDPLVEIVRGFQKNTMPVMACALIGLTLWILAYNNLDFYLFKKIGLALLKMLLYSPSIVFNLYSLLKVCLFLYALINSLL